MKKYISILLFVNFNSFSIDKLNIVKSGIDYPISVILHEFAHAITVKFCYNSLIDINFGKYKQNPLIKFGPIRINSLLMSKVFIRWDCPIINDKLNKLKRILIFLSGPIVSLLYFNRQMESTKEKFNKIIYKFYMIDQILQGFTPLHCANNTDGDDIWREFGLNENNILKFKKFSYFIIGLLDSWLLYELYKLKKTSSIEK